MSRSHFGSIQRLDKDRYRVFWTEGGKRGSHVVRGTRHNAELYLARAVGGGMPPGTTWDDLWKAKVEPTLGKLAARTASDYRKLWEGKLSPVIGGEPVRDMDWSRANEVLTSIQPPSAQSYCGRLLRKMCYIAMRDKSRLLPSNPVYAIRYDKPQKRRKVLVEPHDVGRLMSELEGTRYECIILCELGGGLRPEEADALLWEDIRPYELRGAVYAAVNVCKALTVVEGKKVFKDVKNTSSERVAVIGEPFASRLLAVAGGREGPICPGRYKRGAEPNESWYVSPATISHNFKHWCRVEGRNLPYTCQEHMRSSYATIAGEAMVPDSIVEGNMGHSGASVKSRHYQSVTMRAKCRAADMISDYLAEVAGGVLAE